MATMANTLGATLGSIASTATAIEATADALSTNAQIWAANSKANLEAATKAAPEHAIMKQASKLATARIEVTKSFKSDAERKIYQEALDFFKTA